MDQRYQKQKLVLAALVVAAFLMFVILVIAEARTGDTAESGDPGGNGGVDADETLDKDNSGNTVALPDYITVDLCP